jgi:hypothetical protein
MPKTLFTYLLLLFCGVFPAQISIVLDTTNLTDANGKKQGYWTILGKKKPGSCYQAFQKVEEGRYEENKKTGVWIEYYCNGNIKNKLTFKGGRPEGEAVIYYENGKIKEEGTWQNNRWTGKYKSYDENGNVQELHFDPKGKREGVTIYPFEGPVIQGTFKNSPHAIKEYDSTGKVKCAREGILIPRTKYRQLAAKNSRLAYSSQTQTNLKRLDSLLYLDTVNNGTPDLEFRLVGEASKVSAKFLLYAQLTKSTTEQELLSILKDTNEFAAIRAYAYMAYAWKCDTEKKKEVSLNYSFKLWVQQGCLVRLYSFKDFRKEIRVRNKYNPEPKQTVIPTEEKEVLPLENKIRKEQGVKERRE